MAIVIKRRTRWHRRRMIIKGKKMEQLTLPTVNVISKDCMCFQFCRLARHEALTNFARFGISSLKINTSTCQSQTNSGLKPPAQIKPEVKLVKNRQTVPYPVHYSLYEALASPGR